MGYGKQNLLYSDKVEHIFHKAEISKTGKLF